MARTKSAPESSSGVFALGAVHHDGRAYQLGDELPVMSEQALAALQAAGVVSGIEPAIDSSEEAAADASEEAAADA